MIPTIPSAPAALTSSAAVATVPRYVTGPARVNPWDTIK